MFYNINLLFCEILLSLPSRERGLKSRYMTNGYTFFIVAPFAGAWIEIIVVWEYLWKKAVAPFAGAWIEINSDMMNC